MNTKLITLASSLLAVGALVLSYGAGCGDGNTSTLPTSNVQTNVATNMATNMATNVATNMATNVATNMATNVATNVATNMATNVATNVATNATPLAADYLDDGTIHGYCYGFYQVESSPGVVDKTDCDVTSGLTCPYTLPGTSWNDVAMIGCNVNQDTAGGDGSELTWVPTATSICITGTGFTRIQIQGPAGATDENDRWCANVTSGGGCAAFSTFNTHCWDNGGNTYANEPLQAVGALQPSLSDGVSVAVNPISDTMVVTDIHVE